MHDSLNFAFVNTSFALHSFIHSFIESNIDRVLNICHVLGWIPGI